MSRRFTRSYGKKPHGNILRSKPIKSKIVRLPAPKYRFTWSLGDLGGFFYAYDRSAVRGFIKEELGISRKDRLPIEVKIMKDYRIENPTRSVEEDSRVPARRASTCRYV